jgi:hypothetical protein
MGSAVRIGDGGRDVEGFAHGSTHKAFAPSLE